MITLGPLIYDNLELYRSWRNDYEIWKWCRQNDYINEQAHQKWFDRSCESKSIKMYEILCDKKEPKCVGVCGLTDIDMLNRRAEFSLYINPKYQSLGYGKNALKALLKHGFLHYGFQTIWGETFDGNPASSSFEKIGMKKDGTRRNFYFREGRFIDCHLYSITREEWNETQKNPNLYSVL